MHLFRAKAYPMHERPLFLGQPKLAADTHPRPLLDTNLNLWLATGSDRAHLLQAPSRPARHLQGVP